MQEKKGLLFPENVDVPEQSWYRIDFGGNVVWDLDREGHEHLARQQGMVRLESEVVATGTYEGVLYASVRAELELAEPQHKNTTKTFAAVSGADETSQQVRSPEHVWSVAESRAIKRVVKRALGVRDSNQDRAPEIEKATEEPEQAGDARSDHPDPGYPDPENNDGSLDW
jgi:hypothetical protein